MRVRIVWQPGNVSFLYPIPPAPRTAVLIPGFRSRGAVRVFADGWSAEVAGFEPQAIAGTLAQMEAIAATEIPVSHALIIVGHWGDERVMAADRQKLWTRFGVPVFEQMVGEDGRLLASECEAHEGLHVRSRVGRAEIARLRTAGEIDDSPCACGRTTPRLISREERELRDSLRSVATYAR
jgi:hypothetical protein